jgi:hypothetical protein
MAHDLHELHRRRAAATVMVATCVLLVSGLAALAVRQDSSPVTVFARDAGGNLDAVAAPLETATAAQATTTTVTTAPTTTAPTTIPSATPGTTAPPGGFVRPPATTTTRAPDPTTTTAAPRYHYVANLLPRGSNATGTAGADDVGSGQWAVVVTAFSALPTVGHRVVIQAQRPDGSFGDMQDLCLLPADAAGNGTCSGIIQLAGTPGLISLMAFAPHPLGYQPVAAGQFQLAQ